MTPLRWVVVVGLLGMLGLMGYGVWYSGRWEVERSVRIKASPEKIQPLLTDFDKGWGRWWSWRTASADTAWSFTGTPGSAGHAMAWKGDKYGNGLQTLESVDAATGVTCLVQRQSPDGMAMDEIRRAISYSVEGGETVVTWIDAGSLSGTVGGPVRESTQETFATQIDESLANLKLLVEEGKAATPPGAAPAAEPLAATGPAATGPAPSTPAKR